VIGNTFAWPLEDVRRVRAFSAIMGGPLGRVLTMAFNFVPRFFLKRGLARHASPDVLRAYLAPWRDRRRRAPAVIAPRQLIAGTPYLREVEAGLAALAGRPALIVWGTQDFAFRERERERFERAFPRHQKILLEHASHFLQEDEGERIADAIRSFMAND
jgi:haloalkane dehalogenase